MKSTKFIPTVDKLEKRESAATLFFGGYAPLTTFSSPVPLVNNYYRPPVYYPTTFSYPNYNYNYSYITPAPVTTYSPFIYNTYAMPVTPVTKFYNYSTLASFNTVTYASPFYPYGIINSYNYGLTTFGASPSFSNLARFTSIYY